MPRNPERAQQLVEHVREELRQYKAGEINRISSNEELRVKFGYETRGSFYPALGKEGLIQERRLTSKKREPKSTPSEDAQKLIDYVRAEIEEFRRGDRDRFSTAAELRLNFGYAIRTIYAYLGQSGVTNERKMAIKERQTEVSGSSRLQNLVKYANEEIARFRTREVMRLSSEEELSSQFGYTIGTLRNYLSKAGVVKERRLAQIEKGTTLRGSERAESLVEYVRREIEQVRAGQIERVSSNNELKERFGYVREGSVVKVLKKAGVIEEIRQVRKETKPPSPQFPRSDKARRLVEFVKKELERFRSGEIDRLSSWAELGAQFGYKPHSVGSCLERAGILQNKKLAKRERRSEVFGSKKAQDLANFVREEIQHFKNGEIDKISSIGELTAKFGFKHGSSAYGIIDRAGLSEERKSIESEIKKKILTPSRELAWMLGVLASGGKVDHTNGDIRLLRRDRNLEEAFISVGERLFKTNVQYYNYTKETENGEEKYKMPRFSSTQTARLLGNLKRSEWPDTIKDAHKWVLENQMYIWSLLEGIFDAKGSIDIKNKNRKIGFSTVHTNIANFIANLLIQVGIQRPIIIYQKENENLIWGVIIKNLPDIKTFANNIHSKIPEKEERLEFYRQDTQLKARTESASEGELIEEWRKLYNMLGHVPRSYEIDSLYSEGKTKWTAGIYSYRFGKIDRKKSYKAATKYLIETTGIGVDELNALNKHHLPSYKRVELPSELIDDYGKARKICLKEKGKLPTIYDINSLRRKEILTFTGQTMANYFGEGSFVKARENIERIIAEREKASQQDRPQDILPNGEENQIFP